MGGQLEHLYHKMMAGGDLTECGKGKKVLGNVYWGYKQWLYWLFLYRLPATYFW